MKSKTLQLVYVLMGFLSFIIMIALFDFGTGYENAQIVAAAAVMMSVLWITEAIPLFVTSLLPLVLFPLTGALSAKEISEAYMNSTIFLFMGGFIIAIGMERWNLHKRIALNIINIVGTTPAKIIFGFMCASTFISMWISNTATAVMLLPIGLSIIQKLENEFSVEKSKKFSLALMLGIAYSCSIGGVATLIGTPPNLVFQRVYKITFPNNPEILFDDWMKFAVPLSIIMLLFVWFLLTKIFFKTNDDIIIDKEIIKNEKQQLGLMSFEEKVVSILFFITAMLWIFRAELDLGLFKIPGWSTLLPDASFIDDGTVAMAMAILLFVIPTKSKSAGQNFLLDFSAIKNIPWDIILLFGGGFALAEGFVSSNLSELIGEQFYSLKGMNIVFLIAAICFVITFLTELTSNTATAQILLPILAALSIQMEVSPLILMVPATLSASFAFMLPVATPPNAIVFGSRRIRVVDMARTGLIINLTGVVLITFIVWLFFL